MPNEPSNTLFFSYHGQNNDDLADEHFFDPNIKPDDENAQGPNNTVEALMANALGTQLAACCAEFCQSYSFYHMMMQKYRQFSDTPVSVPDIADFLPEQDYLTALQQLSGSIGDARAYMKAVEAGRSQQQELRQALGLCRVKMDRAAMLIADYYDTLSNLGKNSVNGFAEQELEIIFNLAGRLPEPQPDEEFNAHEERLKHIDYSDAPEEFYCQITNRLMTDPIIVKIGKAEQVYDRSVVNKIVAQQGDKARCPISTCFIKDLMIVSNNALKQKIDDWVEQRARQAAPQRLKN